MAKLQLYHGTSSKVYETIQKIGFVFSEPRFHNWLAPQGIYLTLDRPLLARRFAKEIARKDFSDDIVLEVSIKKPRANRVLDLTTEKGMNRFYLAYVKGKSLLSISSSISKLGKNLDPDYQDYLESIQTAEKDNLDKLEEANEEFQKDPRRFNWDTLAVSLIVGKYNTAEKDNIQLVIAAIQEGTTFNKTFTNREPELNASPNYHGIRSRDHLEVCVTDLSIIDQHSIHVRPSDSDENEFDRNFINWLTNIDAQD